ncbi:MAG: DNA ligase [Candidatus Levybacteria bacterium RIFCSPHIGHO2_01_FULL_40_15b]|nr:MAG: DNA ligase [Candidatus Levybacteria bacterium RIFCSPHIGHO2_01_FULL_40_15b]
MKFRTLAQYYEKLEATSKRLELVDILSKLFKESNADEIGKICYLIQGRVAPFFEPTEIGMSENLVAIALARAFDSTKEEVIRSYRHLGNMGLAASKLAANSKFKIQNSKLAITDVFDRLHSIAKTGGAGSVDKKITILADLLNDLDPISVKHVANIPLGTLRLGIGDPTVLDALSIAKKGDKSLRPVLEDAYNKTSDLGFTAQTLYKKGERGIHEIKLIVGKPIRPALAERLPSAEEAVKRLGSKFAAEPKFDGFRVQIHKDDSNIKLFSRNLEDMTHAFPDIVRAAKDELNIKSAIIEGEAIAYNPQTEEFLPFQETSKRRRKHEVEAMAKKLPLVVFAFDILYLNGRDITLLPYSERRKNLEKIIDNENLVIRKAEERVLHTPEEIIKFFNEVVSEGLEGLMLKKLGAPYKAGGRGFHWIKFKRSQSGALTDTVDCVLLGVYTGKGKRTEFGVGGLLVGVYDEKKDEFATISRVGTGLTDEEWRYINKLAEKSKVSHRPARVNAKIEPGFWVEPRVVLEIQADEITRSPIHTAGEENGIGYALRFPRLVKFREEDKRPEDATTVSEIEKMYKQQYKKSKNGP